MTDQVITNHPKEEENISSLRRYYLEKAYDLQTLNADDKELLIKILKNTTDDDLKNAYYFISERTKTGIVFDYVPDYNNSQVLSILEERKDLSIINDNPFSFDEKSGLTNDHLLIIGENYDALKNLLLVYENKIDVIYIDPPYNTDVTVSEKNNLSEDEITAKSSNKLVYRDKFSRTGWLNMIKDLLFIAKELLTNEGVIFVSIDDHEQAYLKTLMDKIFGEQNFITNFIWQKSKSPSGNTTSKKSINKQFEYVLIYVKNKSSIIFNGEFIKFYNDHQTYHGTKELKSLGLSFKFPKPHHLIKHLLSIVSNKNSIVLDFYAGSGTTAHAVMALNKEDRGNRKFILCTNNEKIPNYDKKIAIDICYERLHRIMKGEGTDGKQNFEWIKKHAPYETNSLKVFEIDYVDVSINVDLQVILDKVSKNMQLIDRNFFANDEKVLDKLFCPSALRKSN